MSFTAWKVFIFVKFFFNVSLHSEDWREKEKRCRVCIVWYSAGSDLEFCIYQLCVENSAMHLKTTTMHTSCFYFINKYFILQSAVFPMGKTILNKHWGKGFNEKKRKKCLCILSVP